jgi:tRNA threonylcarbamoyladenosine biosynthesis protein TsaB
MRTLAIDTSGAACSIALLENGRVMAARHERIGRGHAECLMLWIADLPDGGRADAIMVGCGPGSFTGIRVGIATARGLGLGWSIPVSGIASLAAIAVQAEGKAVTIAIEGGHGEIFVQDFASGLPVTPLASLPVADAAIREGPALVIGSAATSLVTARGWGDARDADVQATDLIDVPPELRTAIPTPIYGRGADARPMALPS